MSRYFCHEHPETLTLETRVIDARPGAVVLEASPFHPGGGGQLTDRGVLRWSGGETRVTAIEAEGGRLWHVLGEPVAIAGAVEAVVDPAFRAMMTELHTGTHILNALVFQKFAGALSPAPSSTPTAPRGWTSIVPTPTTTGCARSSRRSTT